MVVDAFDVRKHIGVALFERDHRTVEQEVEALHTRQRDTGPADRLRHCNEYRLEYPIPDVPKVTAFDAYRRAYELRRGQRWNERRNELEGLSWSGDPQHECVEGVRLGDV